MAPMGGRDGTGREKSKVLQEVLADLKRLIVEALTGKMQLEW